MSEKFHICSECQNTWPVKHHHAKKCGCNSYYKVIEINSITNLIKRCKEHDRKLPDAYKAELVVEARALLSKASRMKERFDEENIIIRSIIKELDILGA